MGLLEGMKRRRLLRQKMNHERSVARQQAALHSELTTVETWLDTARKCASGNLDGVFEPFESTFVLKSGEYAVASLQNVGLIQAKRAPSTYQGGYGGVSFPIFGRVRGHMGGTRGRIVEGDESLTIIETGNALVTNQRMMFMGSTHSQEWPFRKVMACEHFQSGVTTFAISGRSTVSGVGYGEVNSSEIQNRIELAISLCLGTTDRYIKELEVERDRIVADLAASGGAALPPIPGPATS